MTTLIFNGIEFDDFVEVNQGVWTQVCKQCAEHFDKSVLSSCAGLPICGVSGCNNIADFYLDISKKENNYEIRS